MPLSRRQNQFLRSRAHSLKPIVTVAGAGLKDTVLQEISSALAHHELLKVKLAIDDRDKRRQLVQDICRLSGAENVQTIGKILVIYKPADKPVLILPTD